MNYVLSPEELEFSRSLDVRALLKQMGFADDAMMVEKETIRVYCPIHKDQIIRSLIIDTTSNKYHCQYKSCSAHKEGHLVELLALYLGVEVPEAIQQFQGDHGPERQLVARADALIEEGNMQEAKVLLEEAVRLAPREEVTRCKLAAAYLETNERDRGFREYLVAAEDFAVKNQVEKTLSIYNILVMLQPQDVRVRQHLAFLFSRLGRHDDAAEHLKWVVDQHISRGEIQDALKTVEQILGLGADTAEIHMLYARLLSEVHRIGEAVEEAELAAERAMQKRNIKVADQAVTFGLFYRPQNERLLDIQNQIEESRPTAQLVEELVREEDEFGAWLASLEDNVSADEVRFDTVVIPSGDAPVPGEPPPAPPEPSFFAPPEPPPAVQSPEEPVPVEPEAQEPAVARPREQEPAAEQPSPAPVEEPGAPEPAIVSAPESPASPVDPPPAPPKPSRRERWLDYCKESLGGLDDTKMSSMGNHLRSMFDDVKSQFQEGAVDEWEMNVIRDFYATFCKAYDDVQKSPQAEDKQANPPAEPS